jgi:succinate dehydrogenase / fumarate reductase flavoprotein subunit
MQGLADGYFILPYTIGDDLARRMGERLDPAGPAFRATEDEVRRRLARLLGVGGERTVDAFHRELGQICWDLCGMSRRAPGLRQALERIAVLEQRFWRELRVPGSGAELNQGLEKAGRVADFFELANLMCHDALHREESCGGHFREEHQAADGEARRDDERFAYVAAWEHRASGAPLMHREPLQFEYVQPSQRSYK